MAARDDAVYLADILVAIARIHRFMAGLNRDAFLADEKTQSAVVRQLEIVGGATRHIGRAFRAAHPDVPWSHAAALRTLLTHAHAAIGPEILWRTIADDLPRLEACLERCQRGATGPDT